MLYFREFWTGDSSDGGLINGEGYHYLRMRADGHIEEAYEFYEADEVGEEVVSRLRDLEGVNWLSDLGFEYFEALEPIDEGTFEQIRSMAHGEEG